MPRKKKRKNANSTYYGRKTSGKKHSHNLDLGGRRKDNSYDKLYREQLSLLSALFHKKG